MLITIYAYDVLKKLKTVIIISSLTPSSSVSSTPSSSSSSSPSTLYRLLPYRGYEKTTKL